VVVVVVVAAAAAAAAVVFSRHSVCYFFSLRLMLKTIRLDSDFCSDQFDT
jgi:hypothetical protein